MCWMCDHPGATLDDYLGEVRKIIDSCRFAVQAVSGDRLHAPQAYTIGLTEHGRPELIVTGLSHARAHDLLHAVAEHLLHADAPVPGAQIPLIGGPLIEIVQVPVPPAHLKLAAEMYGDAISALQVVHADDRGRWPWDRGYRGGRGGQPVLGPRAPVQVRLG
jgi:hypothetical protein